MAKILIGGSEMNNTTIISILGSLVSSDSGRLHIEGASEEATWNLDHFFAVMIRDYLRLFAATNQTYPDGTTPEEWNKTVCDIADKFDALAQGIEDNPWGSTPEMEKALSEAFDSLKKVYFKLWD